MVQARPLCHPRIISSTHLPFDSCFSSSPSERRPSIAPQTKHPARQLTTALAFVVNSVRSAVPGGLPVINGGNVVDRATLNKEDAEAEKKGVPTHTFDADASPQQKAAQAGKGREKLDSVNQQPPQDRELKMSDRDSPPAIPTIVVSEDTEDPSGKSLKLTNGAAADKPQGQDLPKDETSAVPGALPTQLASAIPDWYKVGWRQSSGIDNPPLPEGEERDKGVLDMFVAEQYYGAWYHNAGIIIFAVLATHFLARFNFGWGWLFVVLAICNTYYTTSMERHRRNSRDDIQRELVKTRLASEHETADWINNFLDRFWPMYEPVLCQTIVASVDQILSTNTPAFLDSLRMTHFTLGNKAPRIDKVRTFPKTEKDVVMMDWGISFTPKDTSDMTEKEKVDKVNPKIELSIRVGKGLATAALPVLVEDVTFSGLLRIRLKLMPNFPHVQIVDICFLEKPVIDYVLKPIGGDTFGFDIANLPGLSSFIRDMTHATLGPMMYDPNVFTLNLEQMLSGKPLDAAIGVVQVVVHSARGITGTKIGGGTPDPYVSLSISGRGELAKTVYKGNTYNPTWAETKYLLVHSLQDILDLQVYDYNDHRKDTLMSSASFPFEKLIQDPTQEGLSSPLLKDGKERGELRYDVNYFPCLEHEEGKEELLDSTVGIVRLVIHQAKELDHTKSLSGDLNPLARVYLNTSKSSAFSTRCFKHTNNPVWEAPFEYLCTDKNNATITIKVIDDRDFLKDPVIGFMSIKLADLLAANADGGRDFFPLSGCKTGKVGLTAEWKPLNMAGSLHGMDQYKPPIGVVKLVIDKAIDCKNVEATLGGKSDPYVRVQVQNVTKGRTEVVNNNLNPVWDQIIYVPVHSLKESLLLECMDYQNLTRDRSLGSVELLVANLAVESPEDTRFPYKSNGIRSVADPLRQDKGGGHKGTLHYTAEFIPSLHVRWEAFASQDSEARQFAQQGGASSSGSDEEGYMSSDNPSSDEDDVPRTPTVVSEKKPEAQKEVKTGKSLESMKSTKTTGTSSTKSTTAEERKKKKDAEGVVMSHEELLAQQSGIIVFHIISGNLAKKARVEVLLDDGYWPCFSTLKPRGSHAQFDYVGEGFMKEVDFGQVWLRLNDGEEGEKDDVVAEWKGEAKAFLQAAMNGPQTYSLKDELNRNVSSVTVEARYIPVPVKLEPRESVNNQGILRVELLDGHEIRGVDRGGKSDPYAVFSLNGQKVFKSQTKKKTVSPEWNENFEVSVPSRVAADFSIEIFDWNQIEQAKSLGIGKIDLASLEPFEAQEVTIPLVSSKHGEKGVIRMRMIFQPAIIAKARKNTSTFSGAGRAMTQFGGALGGLPVNAGKGVFHGVTNVFKRDKEHEEQPPVIPVDLPTGQVSQPVGVSPHIQVPAIAAAFPSSENLNNGVGNGSPTSQSNEPGTLRVTILDAKDLPHQDVKPYAVVRIGDKEFKTKHTGKTNAPEWNESFTCAASIFTPKLFVWIHDHKTIGKDKEIGEGEIDIWRHIRPEGVSSADVFAELKQGGLLRVRLEFDASSNPNSGSGAASIHSIAERRSSFASPSRFSLRGRRPTDVNDD